MNRLTEIAKGRVRFVSARRGELIYVTDMYGYRFAVPISEIGDAEFKAEDKAIYFLRWIGPVVEASFEQGSEAL
jgi:hypothetical protein